jgi:Ca2+-transporting ATPase
MEKWHALTGDSAIDKLDSSKNGLSEHEASSRLEKFGRNELAKKKGISPIIVFFNQFKSPLVYLLILAAIASYFIGHAFDSIMIMAIVLLNAVLGFQQDWKAEKAIEALSALFKKKARVIRDGADNIIDSAQLVPGDVVILEAGYDIPADVRLFDCASLRTNEASLTGESLPIRKTIDVMARDARLHDRKNMAYAGSVAVNGWAKAIVVETGMNTELGRIAGLTQITEARKTHIEEVLESIAKKLVIIFLLLSASVSVVGILLGRDLFEMILTGIALAVAAVPEGLPAVVTITFALGLQRLSKVNTLVRRLPSTETLGAITYIATDKTGTLTKNEMTVKKIFVDNRVIDVSGTGYELTGSFSEKSKSSDLRPLTFDELRSSKSLNKLLEIGALCNHASVTSNEVHGDPTEGALIVSAAKAGITKADLDKKHHILAELSFTEKRKMMSVVTKDHDGGAIVNNKGAPEQVLLGCSSYLHDGKVKKLDAKTRKRFTEENESLAKDGYRVLGIAYKDIKKWDAASKKDAEKNMVYVGSQAMIDPVRPEAIEAIKTARKAGIRVTIVTGDHKSTASAIAKEVGLMVEGKLAIDGAQLDKMSDKELTQKIDSIKVFARVTPEQKMRVLGILQKRGEIVAMTGDGVNDAPALKKADVGVAMGIKGTDVARNTAEVVLADDNFMSIIKGIAEGRGILINIKKFVYYLLSSNLAEVFILFIGMLLNWPLILLPVQLLWINLVTDSVTALSLGVDPKPKDVMRQKPRDPRENILSNKTLFGLGGIALIKTVIVLSLFLFEMSESEMLARTMAFVGLIMLENFNLFNFKSFTRPLHKINVFDNKYLIAAVFFTIGITILAVQIPIFATLFHVTPLTLDQWLLIIGLGSIVLIAGEIYKNLVHYKVLKV